MQSVAKELGTVLFSVMDATNGSIDDVVVSGEHCVMMVPLNVQYVKENR